MRLTKWLCLLALLSSFAAAECPKVVSRAVINATSNGDNTIIASDSTHRILVWQFYLVNSHATQDENLTWKEGSTATSGAYLLKAAGGSHSEVCSGTAWHVVPVGSALVLNMSAAGSIQGEIYYTYDNP